MRLDLFLVKCKKATSRTNAQDLILNGHVHLKKDDQIKKLLKPSIEISSDLEDFVFVEQNSLQKFVSRGGLKLEAALNHLKLSVENKNVLDVGQSTGGFTDCLLKKGAQLVVGVDVGHEQLHASLKNISQVKFFEGLHVKDLANDAAFNQSVPLSKFDTIVADVSFISLTKVMGFLEPYLSAQGEFLFLVKPQFEAGPDALDKNGIVKHNKFYSVVENQVRDAAEIHFGKVLDYFSSELTGKDGNQEFFIYGKNQK